MEDKQQQIGSKVYVARHSSGFSGAIYYNIGEVVKITPGGIVVVRLNGSLSTVRFKDSRGMGDDKNYYLDTVTFDERTALIAQKDRVISAVGLINNIKVDGYVKAQWGKEGLAAEVARLQTLLDAAKAAVEAI